MNKILLVYASKKGMTETLAELIKEDLGQIDLVNINEKQADPKLYDKIIIGSPIYIGKIHKKIKAWIQQNQDSLLSKTTAVYLCGMNFNEEKQVIENNFTKSEINHLFIKYLGGAYRFDRLNFLEKFMIKKITGESQSRQEIHQDVFKELISYIQA
ncbi:hypothetical protein HF295_06475 [Hujiaoplasma nucleasis]|uniref:Flavodoxin-like domain-containing protein n=1 Tax=Hujiaoplasma nucleasis TaxID=2725268 RepID=A0A7L6N7J7_9MOLU|nr:flavodoxin domain-containing protein [Hujiaoplasma nucleasis]QLY40514.1 hypothetical protein HF295_06475 [Hujiaoplasma nucleasis]